MNYILTQQTASGYFFPFTFPDEVPHSRVKYAIPEDCNIIGAGVIRVNEETGDIQVCGEAESLKGIRPGEIDQNVMTMWMATGLSGKQLHNVFMMLHAQQGKPGEAKIEMPPVETSSLLILPPSLRDQNSSPEIPFNPSDHEQSH